MILTHEKAKSLRDEFSNDPLELIREVETAVILKLAAGVLVEPDMGTITIHAKRPPISMGYSIEALNTAIAAARVQALEECLNMCKGTNMVSLCITRIRALIGEKI